MADTSQVKELTSRLEQGVQDLFNSDTYAEYLKTMSRFHRYSTRNTILIHMQRPDASLVAGFRSWQTKFGRNVNKGEKAIKILAPAPFVVREEKEKLDPDTKMPVLDDSGMPIVELTERQFARFKVTSVFDVNQTSGKPLPSLVQDLTGNVEQYTAFMDALRAVSPLPIVFEPLPPDTDGICRFGDRISIREGMSEIQTVCAVVHEITHAKLHDLSLIVVEDETAKAKDRRTEECEAESVAFCVLSYFGVETGANSFGYVASWASGKELKELNASLDTIRKTSAELIDAIDGKFQEIAKDRDITFAIGEEQMSIEPEMPLADILNNREEMIRRIMGYIVKDDPEFPVRALEGMENDYRAASMDGLREAYFFYFPNDPPAIEQETPSVAETTPEAEQPAAEQPAAAQEPHPILAEYAHAKNDMLVGANVNLMPVFIDGNFNRSGKKIRVTVGEPAGKYQIFSREEHGDTALYFMTASGRIDRASQYFDREWDVQQRKLVNHHPSEAELDAVIPQIAEQFERDMADPEKWAMYQHAAVVNRLDDCESHNVPVRAAQQERRQAEAKERDERERAIRQGHADAFNTSIDELADTLVKNEKADIEIDRNLDKNPLFALFDRYEVDLPLATKGWVNRNLKAVQVKPDGTVSVWIAKGAKTSETFGRAIRNLTAAIAVDRNTARDADTVINEAAMPDPASEADKFLEDIGGIGNLFGAPTPPPKERISTMEHELYSKFAAMFPEFMNREYSNLRLEAQYAKPLALEWVFGDWISIAHIYEKDGEPAYEPMVMLTVNSTEKTMTAQSFETTDPPRNDVVKRSDEPPDLAMQRNINNFTSQWLDRAAKQHFKPVEATLWNDGKIDTVDVKITFDIAGNPIIPERQPGYEQWSETPTAEDLAQPSVPSDNIDDYLSQAEPSESYEVTFFTYEDGGYDALAGVFDNQPDAEAFARLLIEDGYYSVGLKVVADGEDYPITISMPIEEARNNAAAVERFNKTKEEADTPTADLLLPDPSIGLSEMNLYGYAGDNVMLPLLQARAVELFDADYTVYLLYPDNTEAMAFDRDEIVKHDGIFGIERGDWERTPEYAALKAEVKTGEGSREADLLYGDGNKFGIYQLKSGDDTRDYRFEPLEGLHSRGLEVDRKNYELVYVAPLDIRDTQTNLHKIYNTFNAERPTDFTGHSLSISDIIVLQWRGNVSSHYVDDIGFTELPSFLGEERQMPQAVEVPRESYSQLGNTPTVAELEADVKAGKTISLLDLSNAVNSERGSQQAAPKPKLTLMERLEKNKQKAAAQGQPDPSKATNREV